jgi:uncharacterized protein YlxW (UPF0749 family)
LVEVKNFEYRPAFTLFIVGILKSKKNMGIFIRLLLLLIPALFILVFLREYRKQKQMSEETWSKNWEEKKRKFELEQELKAKEKEIEQLKNKLDRERDEP